MAGAKKLKRPSGESGLRARAEVAAETAPRPPEESNQSLERAIHELEVHEIELEMQAEELRRAHQELEVSRNRYRALYELAPVGYLTMDGTGVITEANLATESLLGHSRAEFVGTPLSRRLHPRDAEILHLHRRKVRESRSRQACEIRVMHPERSTVHIWLESVPTETAEPHLRSALIDVTARKRAEWLVAERTDGLLQANRALASEMAERQRVQHDLEEREARRRKAEVALERQRDFSERLIEAVPAIVMSLDQEGLILGFNSRMEELSGYTLAEIIGEDWLTLLVPEEARPEVRTVLFRARGGAEGGELVAPLRTKAGLLRQIEWHYATFENHGRLLALGQDVTEKRRIEEERRQAHKMEAVGTLVSGITHDFNNVLTGIIGCADIALGRLSFDHPARGPVEQAKSSALGGAQVIGRLMSFARCQPTERKTIDLNSLLSRLETMLRHLLGEDIELCLSLSAQHAMVSCQSDEIEQVLINLSVNARHAMPRGGKLSIDTRSVTVADGAAPRDCDLSPGEYVSLEVTDTGTGMDPKTRERMFEPFFTTKDAGKGTGLGLSTVYATVRDHGGHIHVDSELEKGTRFVVYLPQSKEPPADPSAPLAAPLRTPDGGETILLVEDEPLVRLAVRHYLERHGYHVLEAAHEADVLRILQEDAQRIDMLLTDTVLPGKGGPEIAAGVLALRPNTPVVYMSAHPNELLVSDGRIPAGTPTLQKPFTEAALVSRVRQALSGAEARPPHAAGEGGRARLLLVEDHEDTRTCAAELLNDLGYDVIAVSDGTAALAACEGSRFPVDLLITDICLPDLDGVELARQLRAEVPRLEVLFLSGLGREQLAEMASKLEGYPPTSLRKPFTLEALSSAVDGILERTRPSRHPRRKT